MFARAQASESLGSGGAGVVDDNVVLAVRELVHRFGSPPQTQLVLDHVSIDVQEGEFVALVGPSGCGKSTLLNLMAGVFAPSAGKVWIRGSEVRGPHPEVGYMIARDALLPWRTARRNVELFLEARGWPRAERRTRALSLLESLGLGPAASAYRYQLSQGMRQRVSLARTLAPDPSVLLMDEPFSALDAQTRLQIQDWFLHLWDDRDRIGGGRKTVIFVTHDLEEAILLADRIIVLAPNPGRVHTDRKVPLPRPRGQLEEWLFDPAFREFHELIWHDLREGRESRV
jgi:NitT/TauT family transport system ATP-binding protein